VLKVTDKKPSIIIGQFAVRNGHGKLNDVQMYIMKKHPLAV
jgi:hypothetical protein